MVGKLGIISAIVAGLWFVWEWLQNELWSRQVAKDEAKQQQVNDTIVKQSQVIEQDKKEFQSALDNYLTLKSKSDQSSK